MKILRQCSGLFSFLLSILVAGSVHAHRVAIFDFDDRMDQPDTVARHIEKKLEQTGLGITVRQFSGRGDKAFSVELLKTLDSQAYDLIITITSDALIIALHTVLETPVLYTNANNPLYLGFKTLGPPGGNISGASYYVPIEDQIRLYRRIHPELSFPGFIFDRDNISRKVELSESRNICEQWGLNYELEIITQPAELDAAIHRLLAKGVDALIATSSGKIYQNIAPFIDASTAKGIPVFSFNKEGVKQGAVAALASDYYLMVDELILPMAVKVLREGVSPGAMPATFLKEKVVYLNTVQIEKLNLRVPEEIRNRTVNIENLNRGAP